MGGRRGEGWMEGKGRDARKIEGMRSLYFD